MSGVGLEVVLRVDSFLLDLIFELTSNFLFLVGCNLLVTLVVTQCKTISCIITAK